MDVPIRKAQRTNMEITGGNASYAGLENDREVVVLEVKDSAKQDPQGKSYNHEQTEIVVLEAESDDDAIIAKQKRTPRKQPPEGNRKEERPRVNTNKTKLITNITEDNPRAAPHRTPQFTKKKRGCSPSKQRVN